MWITCLLMAININPLTNWNYKDFFNCTAVEAWLYGGSNSSKSYSIADKLLLQQVWQREVKQIKTVVIRKTMPSLKRTALDIIQRRAYTLGLPFDLNKQDMVAQSGNIQFVFMSLNNVEDFQKLKSLTDVDYIWFNELLELREKDYDEALRRLRGGQASFEQIIADFNPEDKFSWVYSRGWESSLGKNIWKSHRTIFDNHPDYLATDKAQREIARLKRYEHSNPNAYKIYFLGEWGSLEGVIFNWDVVELPDIRFDEIIYGGDFGFSVDPAALVRIYRKADHFWLEELIYLEGLTNQQLAQRMRDLDVPYLPEQFWDSAEPKSIAELRKEGFNAKAAVKGPDSVRAGINCLLEKNIHIVDGSENLIREAKRYTWKTDKNGKPLNEPIEDHDHLMTAIRYALFTKYGKKHTKTVRPATVDIRSWA